MVANPVWFPFLPLFIIYNNVMDDLDGILAKGLGIQSKFGATLDNVCDGIAHIFFVWVIASRAEWFVIPFAMAATTAIIVRITSRIEHEDAPPQGTPTNELIRHN